MNRIVQTSSVSRFPSRSRRGIARALMMAALALPALGCEADPEPDPDAAWTPPTEMTVTPAIEAAETGAFMSVWGTSGTDVYTVGGQPLFGESAGDGVVFHYDGAAWTQQTVPDGPMLNWVHGAEDVLWIVGERGRVLRRVGDTFEETLLPTEAPLWGVWAASADEAWAVGGDARDRDATPVIFHYTNGAWSPVDMPELDRDGVSALFKVWGTGPDHVFAIGQLGVILHWDGTAWTQVPSGTGEDLVSLWGRGPDDIVAVGGRSLGVVGRWDGTAWTFDALERVSGLNGSWMAEDGTVLVNGVGGRLIRIAPNSLDFVDVTTTTRNTLHGMWAASDGPAFAVGGSLLRNPPYVGDVLIAE